MRNLILFIVMLVSSLSNAQEFDFVCNHPHSLFGDTRWFLTSDGSGRFDNDSYENYIIDLAAIDETEYDAYSIYYRNVLIIENDGTFSDIIAALEAHMNSRTVMYVVNRLGDTFYFRIQLYEYHGGVEGDSIGGTTTVNISENSDGTYSFAGWTINADFSLTKGSVSVDTLGSLTAAVRYILNNL